MAGRKPPRGGGIQGDDVGGRRFEAAERSFAEKGKIRGRLVRQADGSNPHTEENLDHGLDETFPASDPVSIHPGSD